MEDKIAGVIGTGMIGKKCVQKISGLVSKVLCFDAFPANDWIATIPNAEYVTMDELFEKSHVISVHVPLLPETHHLINKDTIAKMQENVIIVSIILICDLAKIFVKNIFWIQNFRADLFLVSIQ